MAARPVWQARPVLLSALSGVLLLMAATAATVGTLEITLGQMLAITLDKLGLPAPAIPYGPAEEAVFWTIRLPRVLLALLVGAALAVAGAAMQGLFRNPLADPGLIGVSSGGAMGAVVAIVLESTLGQWLPLGPWLLPVFAMISGVTVTLLIYKMVEGQTHVATMLLTGIAVNAFAGALIGTMIYLATDDQLRRFTFWTLGSLGSASWMNVLVGAVFILPPLLVLPRAAKALDALLLGEAEAGHLGIDAQKLKRWLIIGTAAMVGVSVALCGMIGFIGLVVPHLVRLAVGPGHRTLLPASALLGAILLLAADLGARTLDPPAEVPIGILTALIGAPFFVYLLQKGKRHMTWG